MNALESIMQSAREQLERRRQQVSITELERAVGARPEGRPFSEALATPGISLIAEYKRRSPSVGDLPRGAVPVAEQVRSYERGGAAVVSILTESDHFGGALADLRAAREAIELPILRKDFIFDRYQLYEAAVAEADAVLLIVAALQLETLHELYAEARGLDLDCLIEVHDAGELERALEVDADVIGINNRNLSDFSVDIGTTFELLPDVPAGKTVVSESGISGREQIDQLEEVGVDAVLIGESLMRSDHPEQLCRELAGPVGETS